MRVSQISVSYQPKVRSSVQKRTNFHPMCKPESPTSAINFKGKFGAWIGGAFGAAAVIATALVAAPAVACLAGGGAIIGAIGGDVAEDAVNGEKPQN